MAPPDHPGARAAASSSFAWGWHRLSAMGPGEIARHARRALRQRFDTRHPPPTDPGLTRAADAFPRLAPEAQAPPILVDALRDELPALLAGRWRLFGHLDVAVDLPPRWSRDALADCDLATDHAAARLNHRALAGGADIRVIWELNRWSPLVRLALAARLLAEPRAAAACRACLESWREQNPPYRGWNWTSALESGIRLLHLAWLDALLDGSGAGADARRWTALLAALLPAHARHAWGWRSFGSSANNHLLGELAGLVIATARWPALSRWGAPLSRLQPLWEREVLAQFAPDGGNREQALNYHLFAWELCWQTRLALRAAGRAVAPPVEERLARAAGYYGAVQAPHDPWDYGDSDNARVTPLFARDATALEEWRAWLERTPRGLALQHGLGDPPRIHPSGAGPPAGARAVAGWWIFPQSGIARCASGSWWLRWDLSPLGYLRTAAHGHLDALHLSVWYCGVAFVVDPGTGSYYRDPAVRTWLACRPAHNGPCPDGPDPVQRRGPFLWSRHHDAPTWRQEDHRGLTGETAFGAVCLRRTLRSISGADGWEVADAADPAVGHFEVRWQFAPDTRVRRLGPRHFQLGRRDRVLDLLAGDGWAAVDLLDAAPSGPGQGPAGAGARFDGLVSPAFRRWGFAPGLRLRSGAGPAGAGHTTRFLAPAL
jgi:hypothetical protein